MAYEVIVAATNKVDLSASELFALGGTLPGPCYALELRNQSIGFRFELGNLSLNPGQNLQLSQQQVPGEITADFFSSQRLPDKTRFVPLGDIPGAFQRLEIIFHILQ